MKSVSPISKHCPFPAAIAMICKIENYQRKLKWCQIIFKMCSSNSYCTLRLLPTCTTVISVRHSQGLYCGQMAANPNIIWCIIWWWIHPYKSQFHRSISKYFIKDNMTLKYPSFICFIYDPQQHLKIIVCNNSSWKIMALLVKECPKSFTWFLV